MYGAPGLEYGGRMETEKGQSENNRSINGSSTPSLKVNPSRPASTTSTARLIYPEYMCFFPTIFLRGTGACEADCPEDVRENAKCQRNGWRWLDKVVELRAEREREKANKNKKETEDNPE